MRSFKKKNTNYLKRKCIQLLFRLILEKFIQTLLNFSFLKIDNYECPHILNILFDCLKVVCILVF